jgi:aldose 1-epimerase
MVKEEQFGVLEGAPVALLTIVNGNMEVELISFGAAVRSIRVPDRNGNPVDVCLGYDTPTEYRDQGGCLGASLGRYANRIGGAAFTLMGNRYPLFANEGNNTLHGGKVGFHKKLWAYACGENSVTFSYDSPDGEEGFPGNLHVEVMYTVENGTLTIRYQAVSDRDTVVNLTNHTYFNLAGHDGGRVDDHELTVRAGCYTPADSGNIPTGELASVAGTPLDLRHGAVLGERLDDPFLAAGRGYDQNFVLDGGTEPAAELYCPRTGIAMEMTTTMEGMQLYTAGHLSRRAGKGGAVYDIAHGVCLETQHFPDAVNHENFPSPVLRAGETLHQQTAYRFLVR